ncbi:YncE family protein [Diaphorobacter caeni]|uniref:YncE family protein n=1 Tax=Diaphorobacter caeni TaxID=2784387 RepID=UPI00188E81CA|nr:YncE family protein [Diaphorobacter caeni]MBF5007332.1 YncE family protein [Diaphorobacter caeni]
MRLTHHLLALATMAAMSSVHAADAPSSAGGANPAYKVVSSIKTDGQGDIRALEVDSAGRKLYIGRDGALEIVNLDTDKKIGQVPVRGHASGVAIAPDIQRGYVTSASDGSITVFDLASLQVIKTVKSTGSRPTSVEYVPGAKRVYVVNEGDGKVTALAADTGAVVGTATLGGKLRGIGSDTRGDVFVADAERHVLHVLNTATLATRGSIATWPATEPVAMSVDDKERRLYVSTASGRMVVLDPDIGQMVGYVSTGAGEAGIAAQFGANRFVRLFVPSADGALTVVKNAKLTASVESKLPSSGTKSSAVAVDAKSGRAFLAGATEVLVLNK